MAEQPGRSKAQLITGLRASEQELLRLLGSLPKERFAEGRYEQGWTGRQILAHVASIEWTYPRLIEVARQGAPASGGDGRPTRTAQGGIDAYNQRQVEQRAGASVADLLAEFRRNRATTIAAVEAVDEASLAAPLRSAGGVSGPLGGVLYAVAVEHVLGHTRDIVGA